MHNAHQPIIENWWNDGKCLKSFYWMVRRLIEYASRQTSKCQNHFYCFCWTKKRWAENCFILICCCRTDTAVCGTSMKKVHISICALYPYLMGTWIVWMVCDERNRMQHSSEFNYRFIEPVWVCCRFSNEFPLHWGSAWAATELTSATTIRSVVCLYFILSLSVVQPTKI